MAISKDCAKEYLPLIAALANGKDIQFRDEECDDWADTDFLSSAYPAVCYRVKPEGKEFRLYAEYNFDQSAVTIQAVNPSHPDDKPNYERNYPTYSWFKEWIGPWQVYEGA